LFLFAAELPGLVPLVHPLFWLPVFAGAVLQELIAVRGL
jgi:hypothetical protein